MSRPVLLISAGAAVLLVALVLLWQSTRSTTTRATGEPAPAPREAAPAPAITPGSPAPSTTRAARPPTTSTFAPSRIAPAMPAPGPAAAEPTPAPASDGGQNLQFGSKQLHAQTRAVE